MKYSQIKYWWNWQLENVQSHLLDLLGDLSYRLDYYGNNSILGNPICIQFTQTEEADLRPQHIRNIIFRNKQN